MTRLEKNMDENENAGEAASGGDRLLGIAAAWITCIAITLAILGFSFFVFHFKGRAIPIPIEKWGQAGDYLGGLINPIVGLATVLLVFIGIHVQRGELRATEAQLKEANKQSKKQSFEQSLFSWLSTYQSLLNAVSLSDGKSGRAALTRLYKAHFNGDRVYLSDDEFSFEERSEDVRHPGFEDLVSASKHNDDEYKNLCKVYRDAQKSFNEVYSNHISDLDALFRTLFRIIQWIDDSKFTLTERWHYVALVRAQLSWIELVYLLYNSLNPVGHPFAVLANKYALFDNLSVDPDLLLAAIAEQLVRRPPKIPGVKWVLESRAFHSQEAKEKIGLL